MTQSTSNLLAELASSINPLTGKLAAGVTAYANVAELPTDNNTVGSMAFVAESNKLYLWNGSSWFNIAIVNQAPTAITGNEASYTLAQDGTPTTVTLVSTDPEGFPLTWSSSVSGDTAVGNLTQADNVFTITPSTDEANAGTLSVTFSVTDGNNTETSTSAFTLVFSDWNTQQAKLVASDAGENNQFGWSIAVSGDTAIAGAPYEDTGATNAGAAYIFTRSGSTWTQQAQIQSTDIEAGDFFGFSVSIDGDTVVIGATGDKNGSQSGVGAAYIFTRSGSTWTQQAKIQASDRYTGDDFGCSVAIDGDTVIVGAQREDSYGNDAGSAYVFTRSGSTWTQQAKIQASDRQAGDYFGLVVGISGDTAVVGAPSEDTGITNAGAAYIFTRSGSTWTQQAKIQGDPAGYAQFGYSAAIDGDTVIAGARNEGEGGRAYIFTRSGSTWTRQQKLVSSDAQSGDYFGNGVAISGDTAVVGAPNEDTGGNAAGAAYVFTRFGSTWTQENKIQASDVTERTGFGEAVAIDTDTAIIGAPAEDTGATNAGAAYIFIR